MASFLRRVLKHNKRPEIDRQKNAPSEPPSPDLTILSSSELAILNSVFHRQEEFEREEALRLGKLEEQLESIEQHIRRNHNAKKRLKYIDVRLCSLYFHTKLSNGEGRICHDCHKKVCIRCGSFSRPRWDPRRNRSVRGRWRCNVCQLKRDVICKSGRWYHGEEHRTAIEALREKVTTTLEASSSDAGSSIYFGRFDVAQYNPKSDTELDRTKTGYSLAECRGRRRQSLPSYRHYGRQDEDVDDDSTDGEAFRRERQMLRQKRYERRRRKSLGKLTTTEITYEEVNSFVPSDSRRLDPRQYRGSAVDPDYVSPRLEHNGAVREKKFSRRYSDHLIPSDGSTSGTSAPLYIKNSSAGSRTGSSLKLHRRNSSRDASSSGSNLLAEEKTNFRDSNKGARVWDSRRRSERVRNQKPYGQIFHSPSDTELGITSRKESIRLSDVTVKHNGRGDGRIEVILHKDKSDLNCKTNGLGMKVLGGRMCKDGRLGTFVTHVVVGGAADLQGGVRVGDRLLKWNKTSLVGLTFEETLRVTQQECDSVQLEIIPGDNLDEEKVPSQDRKHLVKSKSDNAIQQKDHSIPEITQDKPRRRMLPKTPLEMKKVTRHITGRVQMRLYHDSQQDCFIVDVICAESLLKRGPEDPTAVVVCRLLPNRRSGICYQTETKYASTCPTWEEEFRFEDFCIEDLAEKSLEITIWNARITEEDFIGEVLLDLKDAKLDNKPLWYTLEDHDENSSSLPYRKLSVGSFSSTSPLLTSSITSDSLASGSNQRNLSPMTVGDKRKQQPSQARLSPRSAHSTRTLGTSNSSCVSATDRENPSPVYGFFRKQTYSGSKDGITGISRRMSRSYSTSSFHLSDSDDSVSCETPDRPTPEGDDITSLLGPGQIHPRASFEKMVYGDIKLGFMVSKGQLEVDVICVKGLSKSGAPNPPDCYVKTYLMEDNKMIQKKKTNMIKGTYDPIYRRKIKYSACNIHGRFIKINIWERRKGLDKKQCLGETIVKLDSLELSDHTLAWYKLFQINATDHIYL